MAQQRSGSISEDGSPSAPRLCDTGMPHRKDLSVHWVKSPVLDPLLDGPCWHPMLDQLPPAHNAMLSLGQFGDLPSQSDVSELSHDMSWLSSDTPWFSPLAGTDRR